MTQKWRPKQRPQDVRIGKYFMLSDFLYSEAAVLRGIPNCPVRLDGDEVEGMKGLCQHILDPVIEQFGPVSITFAYCSPQLWKTWYGANANMFDLHTFKPPRGGVGGAVDILVHRYPTDPRPVLNWVRDHCVYDRLILYPGSAVICVAWTEVTPRYDCREWVFGEGGSDRHYLKAGREAPPDVPTKRNPSRIEQGKLFVRNGRVGRVRR